MKLLKMIPAVAGIIALTTSLGFARNLRETEKSEPVRARIAVRDSASDMSSMPANFSPLAIDSETGQVYFIETPLGDGAATARDEDGRRTLEEWGDGAPGRSERLKV